MAIKSGNKIRSISPKAYWREILAVLMLLLAIIFFRSERKELHAIIPHIQQASPPWLLAGIILTIIYFLLQGGMYRQSFAAIGLKLRLTDAVILFLKRNFISVFLPAGGVSALAYSPSQIRRAGFNKTQVHQASGLFGFAGLLTVFIAGVPVVLYTIFYTGQFKNAWTGLLVLLLIITGLVAFGISLKNKGRVYRWIDKRFPSFTPAINELFQANVSGKNFLAAVVYSLGVELCGMVFIYIAMSALGLTASFGAAASAYIISVLLMVISPFLRGLGAVELSMVYVLQQYGYPASQALSITILYRIFEFWLPLLSGLFAYAWKGRKLFLRLAPAMLTFTLGLINIISAITPPMQQRTQLLREYIPLGAIHASNILVIFTGISLLITAAFLFRGLRNAWIIALVLAVVSLVGHLTKALDYEEAAIAALTVAVLLGTATQYRTRSSSKWMKAGLRTAAISFIAILIIGYISFYFIDQKHFGVDFTWRQSLLHTFKSFLLIEDSGLHPLTGFAHEFIWIIRILGLITWSFLLFTLIKPQLTEHRKDEDDRKKAAFLLTQFGNSPTDHFKLSSDKQYFFSELHEAFVAYRTSRGFAIVLEEPVCDEEYKTEVIIEFDRFCKDKNMKPAFYRVDENSIPWFNQLRKQKLMIGQEAILDVTTFSLQGKDRKSMRNGLNSLEKKGMSVITFTPPHATGFIAQLKKVSDEWLKDYDKEELIFSQGMFDEKEIAAQTVIALLDETKEIKAFLNIIPDYAEDECTYDLIRKTADAPAAAMDALVIQLVEYAKKEKDLFVNLGMAPMTGITNPANTAEQIISIAMARIRRFQHYKGLREFKEKYASIWENKYLVYDNDFDLLQLPGALKNVMKP